MTKLFFLCLLILGQVHSLPADETDPQLIGPGLTTKLIAEVSHITPATPFTVGFHIQHEPGFHTYWQNPGIVGVATSLKWTLPEGFTASEIAWPYPEKSLMGVHPCYGYERDITLLVTITPPTEITEKNITLTAEAAWMCCAKGCFPNSKKLSLTLPVSQESALNKKTAEYIENARLELPKTDPKISPQLISKKDADKIQLTFTSPHPAKIEDLYFFSTDGQVTSNQPQKFTKLGNNTFTMIVARSDYSPEGKTTLPGILKIKDQYFAIKALPTK